MYDVTLAVSTAIYAAGELLSDPVKINNTPAGRLLHLQAITVNDRAAQGAAMSFFLSTSQGTFGTINNTPAGDVDECENVFAWFSIATTDYIDLGDASIACKTGLGIICPPGPIYIGAVNGAGTPTYAAATDLRLKLALLPL